jgi:chaperone modulatory protein CbpM
MKSDDLVVGVILEDACLTLEQLAAACAVEPTWIVTRVAEGFFTAQGGATHEWRFTSATLRRARRMRSMERDFEAGPELAALVADLLEELDDLRSRP